MKEARRGRERTEKLIWQGEEAMGKTRRDRVRTEKLTWQRQKNE